MKPYLFSFTFGVGSEFPICYHLVYSDTEENARIKLKLIMRNQIYDIENCTSE